jgi:3-phenylpropionate/trans-cinnamate dioxygenase ferredoxin subunit
MASVQVTNKNELPAGTMKAFQVGGSDVLMANCDGAFYAVSNTCTHMGGRLSMGRLDGFVVECPLHGARFDVRTGANVAPPDIGSRKMTIADLKTYAVTVEGDAVKVDV